MNLEFSFVHDGFKQVEYVPVPSMAVDGSGSACNCFIACTMHATVADPPRGISSGVDLDLRIFGATFAFSAAAPSVQVVNSRSMEFPLQNFYFLLYCYI